MDNTTKGSKSQISALQKLFYTKLATSEKSIFNKLIFIKSSSPSKKPEKPSTINTYQPRGVVLCLVLKKTIDRRKFSQKRFSFALIRCLYKEAQRLLNSKKSKNNSIKLKPTQKIPWTMTKEKKVLNGESWRLQHKKDSLAQVRKNFIKVFSDFLKKVRNRHFFDLLQRIKKIRVYAKFLNAAMNNLAKKSIFQAFYHLIYHRNNLKTFEIKRSQLQTKTNKLKIEKCEAIQSIYPEYILYNKSNSLADHESKTLPLMTTNIEESFDDINQDKNIKIIQNNSKTHQNSSFLAPTNIEESTFEDFSPGPDKNTKISKKPKKNNSKTNKNLSISCSVEEIFEEISPGPKKNTKMTKKKKVLLRNRQDLSKISILAKNHEWVKAFALMKWKQNSFLAKPSTQKLKKVKAASVQTLSKVLEKLKTKQKSYFFELLKLKNWVKRQKKYTRITFAVLLLSKLEKKWEVMGKYKTLQNFKEFTPFVKNFHKNNTLKPQFGLKNSDKRSFHFYNKLKEIIEKARLRQKIFGFVGIQNTFNYKIKNNAKALLSNIFSILQQKIFSIVYTSFYEILKNNQAFAVKFSKFQALLKKFVEKRKKLYKKFVFTMFRAVFYGKEAVFVQNFEKNVFSSLLRSSFLKLWSYATEAKQIHHRRSLFLAKLCVKTYFKRISNSFM